MSNPESRISTHEIPHFQDGQIKTVEDTARMILNAGLDTYDQTLTFGGNSALEYCSTQKNVLEICYARRFRVDGHEISKVTLAIRLSESSMVVVVEDALQHPLLETFVRITKEGATVTSYVDMADTEEVALDSKTAVAFQHQLLHLVDYFEIITPPKDS